MKKSKVASLSLMIVAIIWGFAFIGVDHALSNEWRPFEILFIRGLIGGLFLSIFSLKNKWYKNNKTIFMGIVCGILSTIPFALQTIGQRDSGVQNSAIFTSLNVIFIPFIVWILFKKMLQKKAIFAAIVAFAGIFLITFSEALETQSFITVILNIKNNLKISDVYLMLCGLGFAFQIVYCEYISKKAEPLSIVTIQLFTMSSLSLAMMFLTGQTKLTHSGGWEGLLFVAICSSAIASVLQINSQRYVSSTKASLIMVQETTVACIASALIYKQTMSSTEIIGFIFVLCSILIVELKFKKNIKSNEGDQNEIY